MRRVIACTLALLLTPIISCGGGANQICNDFCDCEGCSDKEYEDCHEAADELEDDVAKEDCSAELDAMLQCWQEEAKCDNDDDYEVDIEDCDNEVDDLLDCCDNDCDLEEFF